MKSILTLAFATFLTVGLSSCAHRSCHHRPCDKKDKQCKVHDKCMKECKKKCKKQCKVKKKSSKKTQAK